MAKSLNEYRRKRNFDITSEPKGDMDDKRASAHALRFVIQKHDARRLHYDFRLELEGTLKSWAIPKGPSLDPSIKRLAVHVEDHPLSYASFEGYIPEGQYGGGEVIVWDQGIWKPDGDPRAAYKSGKLKFELVGEKLSGNWSLVRTHLRGSGDKEQWLLIKERDSSARPDGEYDIVVAEPQSVISGAELLGARKKNLPKSAPAEKKSKSTTGDKVQDIKKAKKVSSRPQSHKQKIALPEFIAPELATLVSEPPAGDWLYEIKFDGYRILSRIENGEVTLFTRNGNDWTGRMPTQVEAIKSLGLDGSWLDGEVVVLNEKGVPDFQALQGAFEIGRSREILYYLFDAPFLNGIDLRDSPIEERRAALEKVIPNKSTSPLRFSSVFLADHHNIVECACAMSLEGVIGKRAGSGYTSSRSKDWIKLKCRLRQEFVILGFTKPKGARSGFGALLLGVHSEPGSSELVYAGRVGTGFNEVSLKQLHQQLKALEIAESPLSKPLRGALVRDVHWIRPKLVCEVEFAEWTGEGILRQAAFIALRTDKPAKEIIRERALPPGTVKAPPKGKHSNKAANSSVADVRITHPDRVIDAESGTTKLELASFYNTISEWMLPHIQGRPVSLMRAPEGIDGEMFFQKHAERMAIPHITHLDPALDPGHARLMEINSAQALVGAAQMGTIEFHTWGSASSTIESPDRIIFDLDPDPALPWRSLIEATRLTLAVLDELGLDAFLKTSGGKGMHIVVPLAREFVWEYVKEFSKALSQFMARQIPDRFVAKMGPQNRIGKIFIDYLRNQRGASTVAAFSVRARPGLPVSVPISRDELLKLKSSAQWNVNNLMKRLDGLKQDPWAGYKHRQRITVGMWKKLGVKAPE